MGDQMIQFALATGLDSRKDQHSQELGSLAKAINCVFDKLGAVRKRHGNTAQGTTVLPGNAYQNRGVSGVQVGAGAMPANPFGLMARGGEQITAAGNRIYTYSPSENAQLSKDQINEAVGTRRAIHGSQTEVFTGISASAQGYFNGDVCQTSDGFRVYAWSSAAGGGNVFFSVHDATSPTLSQLFANVVPVNNTFATTMGRVMLIALGTAAVLLFVDVATGKLYASTIVHGAAGWSYGPCTQLSISGEPSTSPPCPFDVCTDDGVHFIVASVPFGGNGIQVARYSPDLTGSGTYTASYSTTYGADTGITEIAVTINNGSLWVVWYYAALGFGGYRVLILTPSTGAVLTAPTTAGAFGSNPTDGDYLAIMPWAATQVGLVSHYSTGIGFTVLDSTNLPNGYTNTTFGYSNVLPISRPFKFGSKVYLLGWIPSALQGTYVWLDINAENYTNGIYYNGNTGNAGPRVVAIVAPRLASSTNGSNGFRQYGSMSNVLLASTGVYVTPCGVVLGGSLPGSPNTQSLWETKLDFTHPNRGASSTLGRNLVTAQGVYDGYQVTEFNFTTFPEGYTGTAATGGSLTPTSVYQYAIIWEWLTDAGELVQSTTQSARNAQVLTVTLGGGQNAVTLGLGSLLVPLTTKYDQEDGYSTPPTLAIYRTQAGGTSFTRVTGLLPGFAGSTFPGTYLDTASDTSIAGNAPLYFEPGVQGSPLDNVCPPSFSHTIVALQRIWGIGDDLRTIWFSQVYTEGFQPGFNETLTMQLEDGDDLVALGVLNANVIIFTNRRIYMTYGTGPDSTGGGTPFPSPQLVQSDVGCIDCRSVVGIPDGLIFKSAQGFCILDQSFNVHYLDGPEDIVAAYPNVKGATLVPEHHEVRFALDNGTNGIVLVLNYWNPQSAFAYNYSWFQLYDSTSNTVQCIVTACGYVSGFRWAAGTGNLYTEDTTGATYMDGGSALANWVTMTIQTGWIEANGIVGYQRGRRVGLLGDWYTSHDLTLSAATDFVSTTASSSVTGQNHTFSSDFAQGGPLDRFILFVKNQKHQALQITVSDAYPTGARAVVGSGQGFSLSGLALQADVKRGLGKLTAANRGA